MVSIDRTKKLLVWVILVFVALILLSANLGRSRSWNPSIKILIEVIAPVQKLITNSVQFTEGIWFKYFDLVNTHEDNKELRSLVDKLKLENSQYRELVATDRRLQELLLVKNITGKRVLASQVISRDPTGWFKSILVDKGEDTGVKTGMPVIHSEGVVGQVVSVSYNYSKVLLIIDQNSAVACIIERSRDSGILKGSSSKECLLDYVLKTSDVRAGDRVITSGLDRIYPKGHVVGEVIEVENNTGDLFKKVKVRPSVDFSKLEEVLILLREVPVSNPLIKEE